MKVQYIFIYLTFDSQIIQIIQIMQIWEFHDYWNYWNKQHQTFIMKGL